MLENFSYKNIHFEIRCEDDRLSRICWFKKKSRKQWLLELEAAKIPAGPVLNVNEMHADPQTLARNMVVEVLHDRIGPVKTIGCPVKFSRTPSAVRSAAPLYGQHTCEVMSEFGYDADEIDRLIADGAVIAHEVVD